MMVFTPVAGCEIEGMIEKTSANEPLILVFQSTFCGPSNQMLPMVYEMAAEFPRCSFYIIDVETFPALTKAYQVKGTPTMILVADNEPKASQMGTMSFDQMCDWLDNQLAAA